MHSDGADPAAFRAVMPISLRDVRGRRLISERKLATAAIAAAPDRPNLIADSEPMHHAAVHVNGCGACV